MRIGGKFRLVLKQILDILANQRKARSCTKFGKVGAKIEYHSVFTPVDFDNEVPGLVGGASRSEWHSVGRFHSKQTDSESSGPCLRLLGMTRRRFFRWQGSRFRLKVDK